MKITNTAQLKTISFKDVPVGEMFCFLSCNSIYYLKIDKIVRVNGVTYNIVKLNDGYLKSCNSPEEPCLMPAYSFEISI